MTASIERLREYAIAHTLSEPTDLKSAVNELGFVQADPIRSPAPAQDLILRNRVAGYRVGDLDRKYAKLDIEEDVLYAYGFMPRDNWRLLHPRDATNLSALEKKVLATVKKIGQVHPKDLEEHHGGERVINAWGGYSKATTRVLEALHFRGLLRICKREKGIRVYETVGVTHEAMSAKVRSQKLVMIVAKILAPVPLKSLRETLNKVRQAAPAEIDPAAAIERLIKSGDLVRTEIDGTAWIYPPATAAVGDAPHIVRILAPFDPLVWDRRRFEYFWGWQYRFEAYTPVAKRVRGYYAMPLLWGSNIIGWANANVEQGKLKVDAGFVDRKPKEAAFRSELSKECARLEEFLNISKG